MKTYCGWRGRLYYLVAVRGNTAKIQSMFGYEFAQRRWFKKIHVNYKWVKWSEIKDIYHI